VTYWTEERQEKLRYAWNVERLQTLDIIERYFPDKTRNSILGKVHRMNLDSRGSPIGQGKAGRLRPRKRYAKTKPILRKRQQIKGSVASQRIYMTTPSPFLTCQFITGDVREGNYSFCGKPNLPRQSWCEDHSQVVHVGQED